MTEFESGADAVSRLGVKSSASSAEMERRINLLENEGGFSTRQLQKLRDTLTSLLTGNELFTGFLNERFRAQGLLEKIEKALEDQKKIIMSRPGIAEEVDRIRKEHLDLFTTYKEDIHANIEQTLKDGFSSVDLKDRIPAFKDVLVRMRKLDEKIGEGEAAGIVTDHYQQRWDTKKFFGDLMEEHFKGKVAEYGEGVVTLRNKD